MYRGVTVFADQVCIILATGIFEWSPALDTYKEWRLEVLDYRKLITHQSSITYSSRRCN